MVDPIVSPKDSLFDLIISASVGTHFIPLRWTQKIGGKFSVCLSRIGLSVVKNKSPD